MLHCVVLCTAITAALDKWVNTLRKIYNTSRTLNDANVEYESYWTDNGAYMSGGAWGEAGAEDHIPSRCHCYDSHSHSPALCHYRFHYHSC